MGIDPSVSESHGTPAEVATKMNYVAALKLLPVNKDQKKKLQAFRMEYPGDPKAAWVGTWTNNKSEFKTITMVFSGDGNGTLYSAIGMGAPFFWKTESKTKVTIFPVSEKGVNQDLQFSAEVTADGLTLYLQKGRTEKMTAVKKSVEEK